MFWPACDGVELSVVWNIVRYHRLNDGVEAEPCELARDIVCTQTTTLEQIQMQPKSFRRSLRNTPDLTKIYEL
jgi:hypothetical protein